MKLWPNLSTILTVARKGRGKWQNSWEGNQSPTSTEYKEQVLYTGLWISVKGPYILPFKWYKCDSKHTVDNYEMKKHSKSRWNTFPAKQISAVLTKTSTIQKKKYKKILQLCQDCFKTTSKLTECSYLSNTLHPWHTNSMQHSPW